MRIMLGCFIEPKRFRNLFRSFIHKKILQRHRFGISYCIEALDLPGYMEELGILFPDNTQEKSKGDFEGTLYFSNERNILSGFYCER